MFIYNTKIPASAYPHGATDISLKLKSGVWGPRGVGGGGYSDISLIGRLGFKILD